MTPKQQELSEKQIRMLERFRELGDMPEHDKAMNGWKQVDWKPGRQQRGVG